MMPSEVVTSDQSTHLLLVETPSIITYPHKTEHRLVHVSFACATPDVEFYYACGSNAVVSLDLFCTYFTLSPCVVPHQGFGC
eukprot:m.139681 g.139681  ORF g.139681 m.139681 type:complete len:82 (+) comp30073_c0_seq2:307-552(+)